MNGLPRLTARALIAALAKAGFETARIRGSHHILKHADGRTAVVPVHGGETIGPGLMAKILRQCRISADDLRKLL
jgi:predicted RNA binding protein YcfA (HicA-like mRNA interferase family)